MKRLLAVTGLMLWPALASADIVSMRGGGELRGVIVERRADAVVIEVGPGLVTVPMSQVTRIAGGGNELAEFRARAARIPRGDPDAWVALGDWARDHGLLTQARESFEHALALDPANAGAHAALGHVSLGGQWLTSDESYQARGYEQFEGRWVRPEERHALVEERAREAERRATLAESDARLREAEARARAAEAEARRAEADAQSNGMPYPPPVYGAGGYAPWAVYGPTVAPSGYAPAPSPPVVVVVKPPPVQRDRGSTRNSDLNGRGPHRGPDDRRGHGNH